MASGPNFNPARGTWWVQWHNGRKWVRTTVTKRDRNWKPGDPPPRKIPVEAQAALVRFTEKEKVARTGGGGEPLTIREYLTAYQESYAIGHRPGSLLRLEKTCRLFLAWCDGRRLVDLEEVKVGDCVEWLEERAKAKSHVTRKTIGYATLALDRALLKTAWRHAVDKGHLKDNPWTRAKVPVKRENKKRGAWSPTAYKDLLKVCDDWLKDILIVGCNSGLRIGALAGLEWRDIRFGEESTFGHIVVRPELDKTGKGYKVPMTEACHDCLFRRFMTKKKHKTFALTNKSGNPLKTSTLTHRAITRACVNAGLPVPDSPNHHMRRTFGRWAVLGYLVKDPVPLYIVSRWMGHASIAMTERYLALESEDHAYWMNGGKSPELVSSEQNDEDET